MSADSKASPHVNDEAFDAKQALDPSRALTPAVARVNERRVARVGFLLPSLQSPEPMVAELAYGEIAAAPYGAMRANKAAIDLEAVRRWVADPALASRHDLYLLLLA